MSKTSKRDRDTKQEFLLTFFEDYEGYEEKYINGFWLVKMNSNGKWIVAIYSKESYENYKGAGGGTLEQLDLSKEFLRVIGK